MPQYELSTNYFFRHNHVQEKAGAIVELTDEQADMYNAKHPGLLKAVRMKAQASPTVVKTRTKKIT